MGWFRKDLERADSSRIAYERARVAAEVAEQVLAPPGPWLSGNGHHLAAALFIESIGWALRALETRRHGEAANVAFEGPPRPDELEELFAAWEAKLLQATAGQGGLEQLRSYALRREFESTARRADETERVARTLSGVAGQLLESVSTAQGSLAGPRLRWPARVLAVLLVVGCSLLGYGFLRDQLEQRADLAAGKPWLASSSHETVCQSPEQRCGSRNGYFFHTREERNPSLEIDLTRQEHFSRVVVSNRRGCCADRAAPLLIEVSTDRVTWRQVARTDEAFGDWRASFQPVLARWVRLRVPRRSFLHLSGVRVLR